MSIDAGITVNHLLGTATQLADEIDAHALHQTQPTQEQLRRWADISSDLVGDLGHLEDETG